MNEKLCCFLKKRGMDDETIKRMEDDKIDIDVVGLMDESALEKYIPKYGDRVAVAAFAKASTDTEAAASSSTCSESGGKKRSLIERLKMKVNKGGAEHVYRSKSQQGNQNAKKKSRRVEIGWLDYDESTKGYKQVKAPSGGGTRHEAFPVDQTLDDIRNQVKEWFFPSGKNRRGNLSQYKYFMTDASHVALDGSTTVEEMYQSQKCKMLRLYLATKLIQTCASSADSGADPDDSSTSQDLSRESSPEVKRRKNQPAQTKKSNLDVEHDGSRLDSEQHGQSSLDVERHSDSTINDTGVPIEAIELPIVFGSSPDPEIAFGRLDAGPSTSEQLEETVVYDSSFVTEANSLTNLVFPGLDESRGLQPTNHTASTSDLPSPHSSPRSPTPPGQDNATVITLRRSCILRDMVAVFMDPAIVEVPIKVRFVDEAGADIMGLSREAYSAFWKDFFLTYTCGEEERVPSIFCDYDTAEWESVGRILLKGYMDTGVYPLKLSYAFSVALINGQPAVTPTCLIESLRMYLCDGDGQLIDKVLRGDELDEDEQDDYLDLLSRVNCHCIPSGDEVRPMFIKIARKELIQEPKFALDAMATSAGAKLQLLLPNPDAIRKMYDSKKPTTRNVVRLLDANPANSDEAAAFSYLKQFIRGLDGPMLKKFLRHVTAAEMLCTQSISVTFNRMRGLGRAPQAHTCGPMLEIPSTYSSYRELRKEFISILESNYLNMDIV